MPSPFAGAPHDLREGRVFPWCGYDKIFGSGKFQLDRIALTGSCGSHEIFGDLRSID
jgi:hypothetical protein